MAIAGIGNLGRALARSPGFAARNFRVTALFDIDPAIIGEPVRRRAWSATSTSCRAIAADDALAIGVITTPAPVAQRVADLMVAAGVRSLLNFAPRVLDVPSDVLLRYVDLSIELQVMSFYQAAQGSTDESDERMPVIRSVGLARARRPTRATDRPPAHRTGPARDWRSAGPDRELYRHRTPIRTAGCRPR